MSADTASGQALNDYLYLVGDVRVVFWFALA